MEKKNDTYILTTKEDNKIKKVERKFWTKKEEEDYIKIANNIEIMNLNKKMQQLNKKAWDLHCYADKNKLSKEQKEKIVEKLNEVIEIYNEGEENE